MTVISSAPMPLPRVRLGNGTPVTGQTAVTTPSATSLMTARPTYLGPHAFSPSVLYGAYNFQGQGLGRAGRTRYAGRPTTAAGWSMSQGRGGRFGAVTARPTYLMPRAFAPSVLYGPRDLSGQGMGRYGRRVRLAGIERFAPSVLYGAYTIQAQGMGRYRAMNRRMGCGVGCAPSRYAGYPVKRLGQSIFSDLGSLFTPNPGGGSATSASGQTTYVDSAGLPSTTPDPNAGASLNPFSANFNPGGVVSEDASGLTNATLASVLGQNAADALVANPQAPPNPNAGFGSFTPWLVGAGVLVAGLFAYKVLK